MSVEEQVVIAKPWRILKFGGTSVASAPALRALVDRVRESTAAARPVVVVWALCKPSKKKARWRSVLIPIKIIYSQA